MGSQPLIWYVGLLSRISFEGEVLQLKQHLDTVLYPTAPAGAEPLENFNRNNAGAPPLDKLKGK